MNKILINICCRYCHKNEIVVKNNSNCEKCPDFFWPDEETATYCYKIQYTHYTWNSSATIGLYITKLMFVSII